eukprot:1841521-Alexandrium_andersonii.AAC.1
MNQSSCEHPWSSPEAAAPPAGLPSVAELRPPRSGQRRSLRRRSQPGPPAWARAPAAYLWRGPGAR